MKISMLVVVLMCSGVLAQTHNMADMQNGKKTVISGADRPELIPDDEAYRAVFFAISKQVHVMDRAMIPSADRKIAGLIITDYQQKFDRLLKEQEKITQKDFTVQSAHLLARTKQELANKMSAEGYENLEAFVTDLKKEMTVTTIVWKEEK